MVDIRNSGLRSQRETVDTGQGALRTANNPQREQHIGRGSFINYYEDLGISTTRPAADQIRKEEADWRSKVAEQESRVADARGKLTSAYGELGSRESQLAGTKLPQLNTAVDKAWGSFKSTLTPIRVIGPNDTIEATYYLPKDAANTLVGQRGLFASWENDNTVLNVMAKNYRNAEVHEPLRSSSATLESEYRNKAQTQIAAELGIASGQLNSAANQLGAVKGELAGYDAQISQAEGALAGLKQIHQKKWDDIHSKYNERSAKMQDILNSLMVGKGKYEDSQS